MACKCLLLDYEIHGANRCPHLQAKNSSFFLSLFCLRKTVKFITSRLLSKSWSKINKKTNAPQARYRWCFTGTLQLFQSHSLDESSIS